MRRNPETNQMELDESEKAQIRAGQLRPSGRKNRSLSTMARDAAIQEFIDRSEGQLDSPFRFGGKKLGTHRKKRSAKVGSIPIKAPRRKPPNTVEDDVDFPSKNVEIYLKHLRSIPGNTYSQLLNSCWGHAEISEEGYRILSTLPQKPAYSLRYVNRIFSSDSWQNIPREDRKIVFHECFEADFRSLHFEIFMMLLRKHLPNEAQAIQEIMGQPSVWDWWEEQGISKADAKVPVQMLINCKSASKVKQLLREPERQEFEKAPPEGWQPSRSNSLSKQAAKWVDLVNAARNKLCELIKEGGILDAFGKKLPRLTRFEYFQLKGEWKPFWMLVRTDLNALYSSIELKLVSDIMVQVIQGYERFKVVLHLHDGVFFQVGKKYQEQVLKKLENDSKKVLIQMDIRSCLSWK